MKTTENYVQEIRAAMAKRSYRIMFPTIEALTTDSDVRSFMEAYILVAGEEIDMKVKDSPGPNRFELLHVAQVRSGQMSGENAAKDLAAKDLGLLANKYFFNKHKEVHGSWREVLDDVCSI